MGEPPLLTWSEEPQNEDEGAWLRCSSWIKSELLEECWYMRISWAYSEATL